MSLTLVIMCCSNIVIIIELFSYLSSNKIETRFDMKYYLGGWEVKKKTVRHNYIVIFYDVPYQTFKYAQ